MQHSHEQSKEQFISEPLTPKAGTATPLRMASGEPGLPEQFLWRGETHRIDAVVSSWKTQSGCSHGSGEQYVRRHWFQIRVDDGSEWKVYCDRQAASPRAPRRRWWFYSRLVPEPAKRRD